MKKEPILTGKLSEADFVELFGTKRQKEKYASLGHIASTTERESMLKEANRYGSLKYLGSRKYEIKSVYNFVIPKNFSKMNSELYQYIIPLILDKLINGHDKNHSISLTVGKWARHIKMVNSNYDFIKYNPNVVSEEILPYSYDTIQDFYNKSDQLLDYYILNALSYLKSTGAIIFRDSYVVHMEKIDKNEIEVDINSNVINTKLKVDEHTASKEEMEFYAECLRVVDQRLHIQNDAERYYSSRAKRYSSELSKELSKRGIKYIYRTYEAYYVNLEKCQFLLSLYKVKDFNRLVDKLTDETTKKLKENAKNRYEKDRKKYVTFNSKRSYVMFYAEMCDVVINNDYEDLRAETKPRDNDYDLNLEMEVIKNGIKL